MKWLFFFLCCLGSGVVGGLVAGALTGPASVQTAVTDTTQVAEGGVSVNEVDNKMLMLHNNISRYFSSKIQVLSKTVNQISMTHNVPSRQLYFRTKYYVDCWDLLPLSSEILVKTRFSKMAFLLTSYLAICRSRHV